jgi:hypothetical protein
MIKFTLTSSMVIGDSLEVNVCLKPSDSLIENYIATYKNFENLETAEAEIPAFIAEMTPILFEQFQEMENVAKAIRDRYEL